MAAVNVEYAFGPFRVDPARRILRRNGEQVSIAPKPLALLLILLERRGEILSKDQLIESLWPDTVGTEANLSVNVSTLRRVLGEHPSDHAYIVTVPQRGYSFVADVHKVEPGQSEAVPAPGPTNGGASPAPARDAVSVDCGIAAVHPPTTNDKAFHIYLRARHEQVEFTPDSLKRSIDLFEEAIALDPGFALAHTGIAESVYGLWWMGVLAAETAAPRMDSAARRALEIVRGIAPPYVWLALLELTHRYRFERARLLFERAENIDPIAECVQHFYTHYFLVTGRMDEALERARRTQAHHPESIRANLLRGQVWFFRREFDLAIEHFKTMAALDSRVTRPLNMLAWCHLSRGDHDAILAILDHGEGPRPGWVHAFLCHSLAQTGRMGQAEREFAQLKRLSEHGSVGLLMLAVAHFGLGDIDRVLAIMEEGWRRGEPFVAYLGIHPLWDPLREKPRFQEIVSGVMSGQ